MIGEDQIGHGFDDGDRARKHAVVMPTPSLKGDGLPFVVHGGLSHSNGRGGLEGDPEEALPDFLEKEKVDLLIMGAVSRSRLDSALIGHTAERLLDSVSCDVLVIKPDGFVDPSKP